MNSEELDIPTRNAVRRALKARYDTLLWVPYARSDRLWETRRKPGFRAFPKDAIEPYPKILLNPQLFDHQPIVFEP